MLFANGDRSRPSWLSRRTKVFIVLFLGLIGYSVFDLWQFAWKCRSFVERAADPLNELSSRSVTPDEAIVVLTGDTGRIATAFEILRDRRSPWLIISGANKRVALSELVNQQGDSSRKIHEVWENVVMESESNSTIDNARESRKILSEKKMKRVILVTSDYHMVRALILFQEYAPNYEYLTVPVPSELTREFDLLSSRTLTGIWKLWVEYIKLVCYRLGVIR